MSPDYILDLVQKGELFGMLRVDIKTPDHLQEKFSETCPIFKNVEISLGDIGPYMKQYGEEHGFMKQPRRSLISSYFGENILLVTPLLQYYLQLGLEVTKIYEVVQFTPMTCFKGFVDRVIQARREADLDPQKAVIAESFKTIGNSSYGKTITNQSKFKRIQICTEAEACQEVNNPHFINLFQLGDDVYEVKLSKQNISFSLPLHIGFFVYGYARLFMLKFYFDFLDHFFSRQDFCLIETDTDSFYLDFSAKNLEDIVKPDLKEELRQNVYHWLPAPTCPAHRHLHDGGDGRTCCQQFYLYDKKTPGKFKLEFEGDKMIALYSKSYIVSFKETGQNKLSSKGLSHKQNNLLFQNYLDTMLSKKSQRGQNIGFRLNPNHQLCTYQQTKRGLVFFYPKRKVLADGISTVPLDL